MAEHKKINELQVNERVNDVYLLRDASLESSPKAGSYWKLVLGDASGSISARIWSPKTSLAGEKENWEGICAILQGKPVWVRVTGTVSEFNGLQLTIIRLAGLKPEEIDEVALNDYVATSPVPADAMLQEIRDLCERELLYGPWKKLVYSVLRLDDGKSDFLRRLMEAPAAKMMHHARAGGLLQHSLSVARICLGIADHYPGLDRQILLVAALLHDIGKLEEMTGPLSTDYTVEGNLLGHMAQGMMMLEPYLKDSELSPALRAHLLHLIASHHGRLEFGAVKEPRTAEAFALHFADDLDAKMDHCLEVLPDPTEINQWHSVRGDSLCRAACTPGPQKRKAVREAEGNGEAEIIRLKERADAAEKALQAEEREREALESSLREMKGNQESLLAEKEDLERKAADACAAAARAEERAERAEKALVEKEKECEKLEADLQDRKKILEERVSWEGGLERADAGAADMLRTEEAAQYAGVSKQTLYNWVKQGRLAQAIKLGPRAICWRKSDLDAVLASLQGNGEGAEKKERRQREKPAEGLMSLFSPGAEATPQEEKQ